MALFSAPDLPVAKHDFGITWYELVIHVALFAGRCMPIWLKVKDSHPTHPFDFFHPKFLYKILKSKACGTRPLIF